MLALPAAPVRPEPAVLAQSFSDLGQRFELHDTLVTWFTSDTGLRARSLQDFVHLASKEEDLNDIPETAGVPEGQRLVQRSRVKQAWLALRRQLSISEKALAAEEDPDLDRLLPEATLKQQADHFFARYKLSYPPEEAPADTLVSRVTREMAKRQLTVKDMAKIRTQAASSRAERKKVTIAAGIELLGAAEVEAGRVSDVSGFCQRARVLMRAMAQAGATPVASAPAAEPRGSCSTDFVEFPLDLGMRVCWRMEFKATSMPYSAAFHWVASQFEAEQRAWVDKYRNSALSLGKTVLEVFLRREALWEPPPRPPPMGHPHPLVASPRGYGSAQQGQSPHAKGKGGKGGKGHDKGGKGAAKGGKPNSQFKQPRGTPKGGEGKGAKGSR